MYYIVLIVSSMLLGMIIGKNFFFKDSIFSDLDIMQITQKIELYKDDPCYDNLHFEWEYVIRTKDQKIETFSPNLQKIIKSIIDE